jgi:hypothetical protein
MACISVTNGRSARSVTTFKALRHVALRYRHVKEPRDFDICVDETNTHTTRRTVGSELIAVQAQARQGRVWWGRWHCAARYCRIPPRACITPSIFHRLQESVRNIGSSFRLTSARIFERAGNDWHGRFQQQMAESGERFMQERGEPACRPASLDPYGAKRNLAGVSSRLRAERSRDAENFLARGSSNGVKESSGLASGWMPIIPCSLRCWTRGTQSPRLSRRAGQQSSLHFFVEAT